VALQSEAPSFQCASNDPGTGWDQADVTVRRDIETATFQVAQKYNRKGFAVWRLPLSRFIQSAFSSRCRQQSSWIQEKPIAHAAYKKSVADLNRWQCSRTSCLSASSESYLISAMQPG